MRAHNWARINFYWCQGVYTKDLSLTKTSHSPPPTKNTLKSSLFFPHTSQYYWDSTVCIVMRGSGAHLIEKKKRGVGAAQVRRFSGEPLKRRFWKSPMDIKKSIWRKTLLRFLEEGSEDKRKKKGNNSMEVPIIGWLKFGSMFVCFFN